MTVQEQLGEIRLEGDRASVRFERRYAATPADFWSAVTEPDRLARWLGPVEGDLRLGRVVRILFEPGTGDIAMVRVAGCEPWQWLEVIWDWGKEAESILRIELADRGGETLSVLDHRRLALETLGEYGGLGVDGLTEARAPAVTVRGTLTRLLWRPACGGLWKGAACHVAHLDSAG